MSSKGDFLDSEVTEVGKIFEHGKMTEKEGNIFVENEPDIFLWQKLLGDTLCRKYDFSLANSPASQDIGVRGKCRFRKFFQLANKNSIFAVDADFDVLVPTEPFQQMIVENNYIFHTVAYSRENLLNSCKNLEVYLTKFKYGDIVHKVNIKEEMSELSRALFLPFLYSLYIKNTFKDNEIMKEFNDLYKDYANCIFDEGQRKIFYTKCDSFITECSSKCDNDSFQSFIVGTRDKGLNEKETYLFLCGKNLEKLINSISEKVKSVVVKAYIDDYSGRLKEEEKDKLIRYKRSEVRNYLKDNVNLSTLREHLFDPKRLEVYKIIEKQFEVIR
ncbi:DUF4435 domain-containing protein [Pseudoalteromonas tetraodonis]|uniref:DUF4435 domain-containing protein n=1 Tax=Pseudoalteromonas tetraodonis TaxID=43659 RepID=UPI000849DD39|nr:DUF4435 domain-containing protein [Pseudoalteromonas tetraodonis]ODS15934.1 hypothetical protein BCD66_16145 [Pseudoalteromonas tetraodonis]